MKSISITVAGLLLSSSISLADSIYDGSGSLISPNEICWGCDKDEARMHPHEGKTSTVSFQWLKNSVSCDHIDIHSDKDLGQDVQINIKSWHEDAIQQSYEARLPVGAFNIKDGISISANNYWSTLSITTKEPISEPISIYAYCRSSIDVLNNNLSSLSPSMTKLDKNHYYLGNASVISTASNGEAGGFGNIRDVFVTSSIYDAEGIFQVRSSEECQKIRIEDETGTKNVEEVLMKGWSETTWKETACTELPCVLNLYNQSNGASAYTLINVRTKANDNYRIYANCDNNPKSIEIKEKESKPKHPNNCQFNDVPKDEFGYYPYITALCSAQIVEGYGPDYIEFGPENNTNWAELTKVVNLSDNFYKTKKIRDTYPLTPWYQGYVDIAKKQGFNYEPTVQVTTGLAYRYIVKVFWNKDLTETESATFLRDKGISYRSNISTKIVRGYMAEIVLKSARVSADESAIERKLPYVNHPPKKSAPPAPSAPVILIPKETFQVPDVTDTIEKKKETINTNITNTLRDNITISEKDYTNNTGLTKEVLGGEEALKAEYQDKTADEIITEAKSRGITNPISDVQKIEEDVVLEFLDEISGQTLLVPTIKEKDDEGNNKFIMETTPGKIEKLDKKEAEEKGIILKSQTKVEYLIQKQE